MSIVSDTELKDYMSGIGLDVDQLEAAQDVLDGLQRQLERYCQRPLEPVERTETLHADEWGRIWPTATPIRSVVSATAGNPPAAVSWAVNGNFIEGGAGAFSTFTGPITLVYVGGVAGEFEADVKSAILRAAAREVAYRHDDVLDVNELTARPTTPPDRREPGFDEKELAQFDRLRRRTVV